MNKVFWPIAFIFCFILFSCSNPQSSVLTSQEDTLRTALQEKNEKTIWTKELEPEVLGQRLNNGILVTNKSIITPQLLQTVNNLQTPVYPVIKGLESLDCSQMNLSLRETINTFAKSLCESVDGLDSYFYSDYFFNYVFFKNDLLQIIQPKDDEKLFERYLICKSFESEDLVQIPVRFYYKKEYIDLSVYLAYHSGYKITQIEIIRWGIINGESESKDSK